jgi:hypothetical protein
LKAIIRGQDLTSLDANQGIDPVTKLLFDDVIYTGGSGGINGSGSPDSISFVFGIQQVYGNPAFTANYHSSYNDYNTIIDPDRGNPVINFANYDNVIKLINIRAYDDVSPPNMYLKDLPSAIAVTIQAGTGEELVVSHVDYVKGSY